MEENKTKYIESCLAAFRAIKSFVFQKGAYPGNFDNGTWKEEDYEDPGLVCLAGSSDTGKSAFLRQLAMSVCAGLKTFLGMRLNVEHHSAIYVSTEDDETTAARTSFLYDIRAAFMMLI